MAEENLNCDEIQELHAREARLLHVASMDLTLSKRIPVQFQRPLRSLAKFRQAQQAGCGYL